LIATAADALGAGIVRPISIPREDFFFFFLRKKTSFSPAKLEQQDRAVWHGTDWHAITTFAVAVANADRNVTRAVASTNQASPAFSRTRNLFASGPNVAVQRGRKEYESWLLHCLSQR
jgi:hypothetical protein